MGSVASSPSSSKDSGRALGYLLLRLAIGMSMLIHGVGRLPKMTIFADATWKQFAASPLPEAAVKGFAYLTPPVELTIGALLVLGLATRFGLTLGGVWMVLLIFGSTLIEKYDAVGIQLIYALIIFQLFQHLEQNTLSLDALIARQRTREPSERSGGSIS